MRFVLLVIALLFSRTAFAFDFKDDAGGISMKLEPRAGERLCIVWPKGHVDPASCDGVDVRKFDRISDFKLASAVPLAVGLIRRESGMLMVFVMRDAASPLDVARDGDAFALQIVERLAGRAGARADESHRVVRLAGRDALELDLTLPPDSLNGPLWASSRHYALSAKQMTYTVSFSTTAGETTWLKEVAGRVTPTIQIAPAAPATSKDGDAPVIAPTRAEWRPFELALAAITLLGIIAAIVAWLGEKAPRPVRRIPPPYYQRPR